MLGVADEVATLLSSEGIEVEIIDPRTLVPLDLEIILGSVERTHRRRSRRTGGSPQLPVADDLGKARASTTT
jgi:hypothetical protein